MASTNNKFDLIIDTVPYAHGLNPYLPSLSLNGTLALVGLVENIEPTLNTVPLVMGRKSIAGSVISSIVETQGLLNFCGVHNITSDIEVIKIRNINKAYKRILKSDINIDLLLTWHHLRSDKNINIKRIGVTTTHQRIVEVFYRKCAY
ncbi:MAG TPA: hypothetical protein VIY08_04880 [Candidatus Nitrosocosmicus sp.]